MYASQTEKPKSKLWVIVLIIVLLVILGGSAYWYFVIKKSGSSEEISTSTNQIPTTNKFGWLSASEDEENFEWIKSASGGWMRPHPGPAVWDMMQKSGDAEIDFEDFDMLVKNSQAVGVNLLITIWPFADWEQGGVAECKVSSNDEFLAKNDTKGRQSYLPEYRCNPNNWDLYRNFIKKVVERYDGDGKDDMPELKYPIKYWEAMNEPDLASERLTFYKLGPEKYVELLQHTYQAVKEADASAKVLIAGAAGGNEEFLNFYKKVFESNPKTKSYFDIGNIHCISNDQQTHDFNVAAYEKMLTESGVDKKPIWVTEAEAMYQGSTFEENVQNTATSVKNAIAAGAERIFFTRYDFADNRTDMSEKIETSKEDAEKSRTEYKTIISENS